MRPMLLIPLALPLRYNEKKLLKKVFGKKNDSNDQTFIGHLEAFRKHLMRMALALVLGAILCFVFIEKIFDAIILAPTHASFPPYRWLCSLATSLNMPELCMTDVAISFQNIKLSGQFMMSITSSLVFAFVFTFPYIMWELWRFIKPGLTPREIKMSTGIIFWVSLLFFLGVLFGYYIITPYTVNFFANYKISPQFENIIKIDDYLSTVLSLALGTGLVFELPVIIYFLSKIGIVTARFLREYRRYAIVAVLVLAAVITPPDMVSQILVAIPIMFLYEISIGIAARVEKRKIAAEKKLLQQYK